PCSSTSAPCGVPAAARTRCAKRSSAAVAIARRWYLRPRARRRSRPRPTGNVPLMTRLDPQALVTHLDRLYRVAWALCGSREEAEDLVQETAARVLAKPRQLRGQDELAYLVQALRNTFLLSRRTASRRPREVAMLEQLEPPDVR